MKNKPLLLLLAAFAILIGCTVSACGKNDGPDGPAATTVLVYAVATNDLSDAFTDDMAEMERGILAASAASRRDCRWLVYKRGFDAPPTLYELTVRGKRADWRVLKTYPSSPSSLSTARFGEVMGDLRTLAPADSYGLVLWSHASGWNPAEASADESPSRYSFGIDYGKNMNITDLAASIPDGMFGFIWADCCFMGGIEVAWQLRDKCDVYVASPTEVPYEGAPYDIVLPMLMRPQPDVAGAARAFFEYYDAQEGDDRSATIAVVRTGLLGPVATACRALMHGREAPEPDGWQRYHRAKFGPYYDLRDMGAAYADTYGNAAALDDLRRALGDAVVYAAATPRFINLTIRPDHFCGLSSNRFADSGSEQDEFYRSYDWYSAVYR